MKESTGTSAGNCPLMHWGDLPDKQQSMPSQRCFLPSQALLPGLVLPNTSFNRRKVFRVCLCRSQMGINEEERRSARSTERRRRTRGQLSAPDMGWCWLWKALEGRGRQHIMRHFEHIAGAEAGPCTVGNCPWLAWRWTDRFNKPLPSLSSVILWHFLQESNTLPN